MTEHSVSTVLSTAAAAMVSADSDVSDGLATLLAGACEVLQAGAVAVLVEFEGSLELLSASSHGAADLEIQQAQLDEGPCIEAMEMCADVVVSGADAIRARWPRVGPLIVDAGYHSVWAAPMRWHGKCFGGLNMFFGDGIAPGAHGEAPRALADAATMLIVSSRITHGHLTTDLRQALAERALIEQAKGALSYVRSEDMASSYRSLRQVALEEGISLRAAARAVLDRARAGTLR